MMATPADMLDCERRNGVGYPCGLNAEPGAAIHVGGDSNQTQATGASIVYREQAQKWLVPLLVLLTLVLTANAMVMGFNMSRQSVIETQLRNTQVAEDLRKYETQQLRVQASLNTELQKIILAGCKR